MALKPKVYVPYGKHCTECTMMQQPNPVQAVCNTVDSVQRGLGLLSVRRRVYSIGLPIFLGGWENDLLRAKQSHSNLDFIQLEFPQNLDDLPLVCYYNYILIS